MRPNTILAIAFCVILAAIAAWDIFVLAKHRPEDTVSSILSQWATQAPVFAVAVGLVLGHIFWPADRR
jgi:hypothetical protein